MSKKIYNGLDLVNGRIVNLASPSGTTDAANKQYVDNLVNGQSWKQAVQAATTATGTLTTAYAAGQVIDGYTLATNDRILIKNQSTASENGLYTVNATGAPSRAADGATGELLTNATVRINNGSVNLDAAWTLTTVGTITVGTTNQTWARSDSGTPYTAGNGLGLSSNAFSVTAGFGILADGTSTRIDTTYITQHKQFNVGDGTSTTITLTHSLGTRDVIVCLYDASTFAVVDTDVVNATTNTVTLTFASAPTSNQFKAVVMG